MELYNSKITLRRLSERKKKFDRLKVERRHNEDPHVDLWKRRCPQRAVKMKDVHPCGPFHTLLRVTV